MGSILEDPLSYQANDGGENRERAKANVGGKGGATESITQSLQQHMNKTFRYVGGAKRRSWGEAGKDSKRDGLTRTEKEKGQGRPLKMKMRTLEDQ